MTSCGAKLKGTMGKLIPFMGQDTVGVQLPLGRGPNIPGMAI
jgi:hypothetical protein